MFSCSIHLPDLSSCLFTTVIVLMALGNARVKGNPWLHAGGGISKLTNDFSNRWRSATSQTLHLEFQLLHKTDLTKALRRFNVHLLAQNPCS
jgi:hypothetical protein